MKSTREYNKKMKNILESILSQYRSRLLWENRVEIWFDLINNWTKHCHPSEMKSTREYNKKMKNILESILSQYRSRLLWENRVEIWFDLINNWTKHCHPSEMKSTWEYNKIWKIFLKAFFPNIAPVYHALPNLVLKKKTWIKASFIHPYCKTHGLRFPPWCRLDYFLPDNDCAHISND